MIRQLTWPRLLTFGAMLIIGLCFGMGHLLNPTFFQQTRLITFDMFQKIKPRPYQDVPVRFLDIDQESLQRLGQWPWSRIELARLVDRLQTAGAAAITFDVVFAEPDRTSPNRVLEPYATLPGMSDLVAQLPDSDRVFAKTLARGRVVTGFVLTNGAAGNDPPHLKQSFLQVGAPPVPLLPKFSGSIPSLVPIQAAAAGNGAMNFISGNDGIIRRAPLALSKGGKIYPTLGLEALRVALGNAPIAVKSTGASSDRRAVGRAGIVSVRVGGLTIPTNRRGEIFLYHSPSDPRRTIPIWRVMQDKGFDLAGLAGKILIIGTSAPGLQDLRLSPLGGVRAGGEMHAQMIENILTGQMLSRPDWAKGAETAAYAALACLVMMALYKLRPLLASMLTFGAIAGYALGCWYLFSSERLLIDPTVPSMMALAFYGSVAALRYFIADEQSRYLRGAFASYVSPNLVSYIATNASGLKLGGSMTEMTSIFTDIEGFTSMVEQGDPIETTSMLNAYLDEMIGIAFDHGGTLDKVIGDALSIMFSTPIRQEDHAARGVSCALALYKASEDFRARQKARGLAFGRTRIGINSGVALVGNFGGNRMFDYTAHGDCINTAARLEGANKYFGTQICASKATLDLANHGSARPIGDVVLKGKTQGLAIMEPLAPNDPRLAWLYTYRQAYDALTTNPDHARILFEELYAAHPEDGLVAFHLSRLQSGQTGTDISLTSK